MVGMMPRRRASGQEGESLAPSSLPPTCRCRSKCTRYGWRRLKDLIGFLSELHSLDIDLALHQQGIDTTTPAGKAMFQMMGVFAEFERSMIVERVRAGVARAKASGTKSGKAFGRPRTDAKLEQRIRDALADPGRPDWAAFKEKAPPKRGQYDLNAQPR